MLYREIIAVCSEIHTKYINTLCGQKVELLNVKPGGTYICMYVYIHTYIYIYIYGTYRFKQKGEYTPGFSNFLNYCSSFCVHEFLRRWRCVLFSDYLI